MGSSALLQRQRKYDVTALADYSLAFGQKEAEWRYLPMRPRTKKSPARALGSSLSAVMHQGPRVEMKREGRLTRQGEMRNGIACILAFYCIFIQSFTKDAAMSMTEEAASAPNHALKDALAWISKFAHAWKAIEPAPGTLSIDGFIIWGPVLYEKHKDEDPVKLAQHLFGKSGRYFEYLYPGSKPKADKGHADRSGYVRPSPEASG
jgi:hypothetical protein